MYGGFRRKGVKRERDIEEGELLSGRQGRMKAAVQQDEVSSRKLAASKLSAWQSPPLTRLASMRSNHFGTNENRQLEDGHSFNTLR